jgi:tetratricopeptide (TPR) repeat protein
LRQFVQRNWLWGLLAIVLLGTMSAVGGYSGLLSGQAERRALAEAAAVMDLAEQVNLGLEDLQSGRFDVARQRFEFVLNQDPNFPGAADGLVQALQVLNATATPTPPPATPTLTPTRDLRPVEELLAQALAQMNNSDWAGVIDTLNGLRKEDPDYQVTRVDGYLYIALRYRGIDKILNQSNLEGGIYDLSLAEQFGPLDSDALGTRNLARLYIIGSSFWEALPEQAVFYFSQVAAAAPYLRDASGWTARERYRLSLVQYGDQLAASENWCDAQIQYETALSMQADPAIGEKAEEAALMCAPPTETPTLTETATLTPTLTLTPSATLTVEITPEPTTPVATTPAGTTEVPTVAPTTPAPTTAGPSTPTLTPTPTPSPTTEVPPPDDPTPTETTAAPFEDPSTFVPPAATTAAPLEIPPEVPAETYSAPVGLIPSSERMLDV